MNLFTERQHSREVPQIVRVILTHIAQQRRAGEITPESYEAKLGRLRREDLVPHGFTLLERPLRDGRIRYLIKETQSGAVRDIFDCGPKRRARAKVSSPRRKRSKAGANGASADGDGEAVASSSNVAVASLQRTAKRIA
jgi:hypothetical protein